MVDFKLISIRDGYYHYEVYPEGKTDDIGWIIFNPETKDVKEKVFPKAGSKYLCKAVAHLRDENGKLKESGMVAWY